MEVLYCDSFVHEKSGEHVDEVLFKTPVIVSACHIVPKDGNPEPDLLEFRSLTAPSTLDFQVFYKIGSPSASKFEKLGPKVSWTPEGVKETLDVQPIVTSHLVFRGNYQNLSLIVYGATIPDETEPPVAKDTEVANALALEAAPPGSEATSSSSRLHVLSQSRSGSGGSAGLMSLLKAGEEWAQSEKLVNEFQPNEPIAKSISEAADQVEAAVVEALLGSTREGAVEELPAGQSEQANSLSAGSPSAEHAVRLIIHWLAGGGDALPAALSGSLVACSDRATCYRFLAYGGTTLLTDLLTQDGVDPAIKMRVLACLSELTSHGFGCEALLGWWSPALSSKCGAKAHLNRASLIIPKAEPMEVDEDGGSGERQANGYAAGEHEQGGPSKAYGALLSVLLKPQSRRVALLAAGLLKRLKLYELAAEFGRVARQILRPELPVEAPSSCGRLNSQICVAADLLHEIVSMVSKSGTALSEWPLPVASFASASDLNDIPLQAASGKDKGPGDPALWTLLKDRQVLPTVVALLSSPAAKSAHGGSAQVLAGLLSATWALVLPLLDMPSGLLSLAEQPAVVKALVSALGGCATKDERGTERVVPKRQLEAVLALGVADLCSGCQLARLLQGGVRAVSLLDGLLAAAKVMSGKSADEQSVRRASIDALSAAKELSQLATSESSRQAVVTALSFPEALPALIQLLMQQGPQAAVPLVSSEDPPEASILPHHIGLICLALLNDPSPSTLPIWARQSLHLQAAIVAQGAKPSPPNPQLASSPSDAPHPLSNELNSWIAPAVVWRKNGPLALLQLLTQLTGLRIGPSTELGFNLHGYQLAIPAVDADLGSVSKEDLDRAVFASPAATANATSSMRLLASLAVHPAVAAAVYDEGGIEVLLRIMGQATQALDELPTYYNLPGDSIDAGSIPELVESAQERRILLLLLPTLSLATLVLTRLQVSGVQYRNTALVNALLALNSALSSRPAYTADVLKVSPSGITLLLHAVRQGLASVAAFWAVNDKWGPGLLPKLVAALPQDTGTVAGEAPRAVLGLVHLLADILPEEFPAPPSQAHSLRLLADSLPVIALGSVLGPASLSPHTWSHKQGEKLARAVAPHLDKLAASLGRLVMTSCQPLQEALTRLSCRLSALGTEHSQAVSRHVYAPVQSAVTDYLADSPGAEDASPQEKDTRGWRLVRALTFLGLLAQSPAQKASFLSQSVTAQMASLLRSASGPAALVARLGMGALAVLQNLLNPAVCLTPQAPLAQRMVEAAPDVGQSEAVGAALLDLLSRLNVKDGRTAASLRVLGIMAGHDVGRAALARAAWQRAGGTLETDSMQEADSRKGSFTFLWEALAAALSNSLKSSSGSELAHLLCLFATAGLRLADGGQSQHGVRALHALFEGAQLEREPLQAVIGLLGEVGQKTQGPALRGVSKALRLCSALAHILASEADAAAVPPETALSELSAWATSFEAPRELSEQFEEAAAASAAKAKIEEGSTRIHTRAGGSSGEGVNGDGLWSRCLEGWVSFREEGGVLTEQRPQDQAWSERLPWQYSPDIVWPPEVKRSLKRRAEGEAEGEQAKKQKAVQSAAQQAAATLAARKDPFRARRQNTGRPPSMHVDDFVAQQKGNAQSTAARVHTGGRAPSIRVDDFMKLESEKGRTVVGAPVQDSVNAPLVAPAKPAVLRAPVRTPGQGAVVKQRLEPPKQVPPPSIKAETKAQAPNIRPQVLHPPLRPAQPPQARPPLPPEIRPPIQSLYTTLAPPALASPAAKRPAAAWPKPLHEIAQATERPQSEASPKYPQASAPLQPFADPRRSTQGGALAEASAGVAQAPSIDPRRAGLPPVKASSDPRRNAAPPAEALSLDPRRPPAPADARRQAPLEAPAQDPRRAGQNAAANLAVDPRRRTDPRLAGRPDASPPVPQSPGWQQQPSPGGNLQPPRASPQNLGQSPPAYTLSSPPASQAQAWQQRPPTPTGPSPASREPAAQPPQPPAAAASVPGGQAQGAQAGPSAPQGGRTTAVMSQLQEILKQPGFIQGLLKDKARMTAFLSANPAIVPMLKNMLAQMGRKAS